MEKEHEILVEADRQVLLAAKEKYKARGDFRQLAKVERRLKEFEEDSKEEKNTLIPKEKTPKKSKSKYKHHNKE